MSHPLSIFKMHCFPVIHISSMLEMHFNGARKKRIGKLAQVR